MNKVASLADFLDRHRITNDVWENADIKWDVLEAIAVDHDDQRDHLQKSGELFANLIQKFSKVHSVRWRVKDTEHLIVKIIRKRAEGSQKYADISVYNYFEIITDLVGVRALHLFKDDCFAINDDIKSLWKPVEQPVAYIRSGDADVLTSQFREHGFEIKEHPAGYRSVHYILSNQPVNRKVFTEVQVRTIFEEAWSEIDHKVRYPNFSDNAQVEYFLTIFNRMAGSADEMGGFVRELASTLSQLEQQVAQAQAEKAASVKAMEEALSQMETIAQQDRASQESIATLKAEVAKLRIAADNQMPVPDARDGRLLSSVVATTTANNLRSRGLIDSAFLGSLSRTLSKDIWESLAIPRISDVQGGLLSSLGIDKSGASLPKGLLDSASIADVVGTLPEFETLISDSHAKKVFDYLDTPIAASDLAGSTLDAIVGPKTGGLLSEDLFVLNRDKDE